LAWPFDAAIALPTSALNAFSLPARNSATIDGCAAITSSTSFASAPSSEICFIPFAAMILSAASSPVASPAHIASNTSFACLPEIVPSAMRFSKPASAAGVTELRRSRFRRD
jgi:hypothetical protein